MHRPLLLVMACLILPAALAAQGSDTIRVCTYNVLEYGSESSERDDELRMILDEIRPTVLFVQEITRVVGNDGFFRFLPNVINQLEIQYEPIVTGWSDATLHVAAFIDTSRVEIVWYNSGKVIDEPRGTLMVVLRIRATDEHVLMATAQWKPDNDPEDRMQRLKDAELMVEYMEAFSHSKPRGPDHYLVAADLNVYTSDEEAYQVLLTGDSGVFNLTLVDPIATPGDWNNNESFAGVHTQSTRIRGFGGAARGGLDDRFDQILVSESLLGNVLVDSYTSFGNDGNHFNDSINASPNLAVSAEMAQALHDASDHLPVYVDLVFPRLSSVKDGISPGRELDLTGVEADD